MINSRFSQFQADNRRSNDVRIESEGDQLQPWLCPELARGNKYGTVTVQVLCRRYGTVHDRTSIFVSEVGRYRY